MWICFSDAFLSIVEPSLSDRSKFNQYGDVLMVRARRRGDIERVFPDAEVTRTQGRDYLWRAFLPREQVAQVIAERVTEIDYFNFKGSVEDHRLHAAYNRFWSIHSGLQELQPYSTGRNRRQGGLL